MLFASIKKKSKRASEREKERVGQLHHLLGRARLYIRLTIWQCGHNKKVSVCVRATKLLRPNRGNREQQSSASGVGCVCG